MGRTARLIDRQQHFSVVRVGSRAYIRRRSVVMKVKEMANMRKSLGIVLLVIFVTSIIGTIACRDDVFVEPFRKGVALDVRNEAVFVLGVFIVERVGTHTFSQGDQKRSDFNLFLSECQVFES